MSRPKRPLYLITDCETTGLHYEHDAAYEVAMIGYDGTNVLFRSFFLLELNPEQTVSEYTRASSNYQDYLHLNHPRLTGEEANARLSSQIAAAQRDIGTNYRHTFLVGSNPSFDKHFIGKATNLNLGSNGEDPSCLVSHKLIDLSNIAMTYFRSHEPIGQAEIQKRLMMWEQMHGAIQDAEDALECFRIMTRELEWSR